MLLLHGTINMFWAKRRAKKRCFPAFRYQRNCTRRTNKSADTAAAFSPKQCPSVGVDGQSQATACTPRKLAEYPRLDVFRARTKCPLSSAFRGSETCKLQKLLERYGSNYESNRPKSPQGAESQTKFQSMPKLFNRNFKEAPFAEAFGKNVRSCGILNSRMCGNHPYIRNKRKEYAG